MGVQRWWLWFVDAVTIVWICLFAVDIAAGIELISLSKPLETTIRQVLRSLFLVFVLDVLLLYRWSDDDPRTFVRSKWFLILTVVPWFRPLRLLRAGRGVRALRLLAGSRRAGAFSNKVRRMWNRLWNRIRG